MKQTPCQVSRYACRKVAGDLAQWKTSDWQDVSPAEPFILASGAGIAKHQTQVKAVWTETALHIAFWCEDPEPWATMTLRDESLYEEEVVELFLAPNGDHTRYFEFEINPLGALFDAEIRWHHQGSIEVRREWDCRGLAGTAVIEAGHGWRAQLTIPFAGLQARPAAGETWAANFYRIERRPVREFSSWSPLFTDPPEYHSPERFGRLMFTED